MMVNSWEYRVLKLVERGYYQNQIAKELEIHPNRAKRILEKLQKQGEIRILSDWPKVYRVATKEEKMEMARGQEDVNLYPISIHSTSLKYYVLGGGNFDLPEVKYIKHQKRSYFKDDNVTIEKTSKHIIIHPKISKKGNPYDIILESYKMCNLYIDKLEKEFPSLVLSEPSLCRPPHIVVEGIDILFDGQVTSKDWHIDDSHGTGNELEFTNLNAFLNTMKKINEKPIPVNPMLYP